MGKLFSKTSGSTAKTAKCITTSISPSDTLKQMDAMALGAKANVLIGYSKQAQKASSDISDVTSKLIAATANQIAGM